MDQSFYIQNILQINKDEQKIKQLVKYIQTHQDSTSQDLQQALNITDRKLFQYLLPLETVGLINKQSSIKNNRKRNVYNWCCSPLEQSQDIEQLLLEIEYLQRLLLNIL